MRKLLILLSLIMMIPYSVSASLGNDAWLSFVIPLNVTNYITNNYTNYTTNNITGGLPVAPWLYNDGADLYYNYSRLIFEFYNSSQVDALLAAQDECSEISGCVVGAITTSYNETYAATSADVTANRTDWLTNCYNASYLTSYTETDPLWSGNFSGQNLTIPNNLTVGKYLAVNGSTLYVDALNRRVGIGTTSPQSQLSLSGAGQSTTALTDDGATGGMLTLTDTTNLVDTGGALAFGGYTSGKRFSAIKGVLVDSSGNTSGGIAFSTRRLVTDNNLTEAMRILRTGNVGIGTAAAAYKLEVNGTSRISGPLYVTSSGADAIKTRFISGADSPNTTDGPLYLQYGKVQNVYIGQAGTSDVYVSGKVGIGALVPATKLHVNDSSSMTPMTLEGSASGSYINLKGAGLSKGYMGWTTSGDDGIAFLNGSGSTVNVLITDSGNVGIGLTSPLYKLTVNQSATGYGFVTSYGSASFGSGISGDSGNPGIIGTLTENKLYIRTNNTNRMVFDTTNGNVGIGTTSPTQKLDVNGTMNVSNITLKANCADGEVLKWADGAGKCGTDSTGAASGTSFAKYNRTTANYGTNITATYQKVTNLTLNLATSGISTIWCDLPVLSNDTKTGIQYNVTITGSSAQTTIIDYLTSATATAVCSGTTAETLCAPTASAGTAISRTQIYATSVRSGAGQFLIELKTEVAGPLGYVNITAGANCRAVET